MLDGLTQFMESHGISSLKELQAKRPMEFSAEEDRRKTIEGLSPNPVSIGIVESDHVIRSDKWGHPVA